MSRIKGNIDSILLDKVVGKDAKTKLPLLKRERVEKPVIYVGAGTCGLGAGAGKTLEEIKTYLDTNSIDAEIIEVGCIGLCAAEPIVDIQLPNYNRVAFKM